MINLFESNRAGVMKAFKITEEDLKINIAHLREWLKKQPHLPFVEDWKLEVMLIRSQLSLEKVKRRIDLYYSVRNFEVELYTNWDPTDTHLHKAIGKLSFVILPKLTNDLCQVGLGRVLDPSTDNYSPVPYLKVAIMLTELQLQNFYCMGQHMIYDMRDVQLLHLLKITPSFLQTAKTLFIKVYPYRFKGIHFVNTDSKLEVILTVLKQVMNPSIYEKIHVHSNLESLYKIIPKELLPRDYGGNQPAFIELHNQWIMAAVNNKEWFDREIQIKSDETKRLSESIESQFYGSMDGSFRSLKID